MGKPITSLSCGSWICLKDCTIGERGRKRANSYTFHIGARVQVSSLSMAGRPGPLSGMDTMMKGCKGKAKSDTKSKSLAYGALCSGILLLIIPDL